MFLISVCVLKDIVRLIILVLVIKGLMFILILERVSNMDIMMMMMVVVFWNS